MKKSVIRNIQQEVMNEKLMDTVEARVMFKDIEAWKKSNE